MRNEARQSPDRRPPIAAGTLDIHLLTTCVSRSPQQLQKEETKKVGRRGTVSRSYTTMRFSKLTGCAGPGGHGGPGGPDLEQAR